MNGNETSRRPAKICLRGCLGTKLLIWIVLHAMIMFTPAAQLPEAARSLRSPMPPRQTWHSKKTGSAWTRENFDEKNNFQCSVSFSVHSASFSKFCLSLAWLESNYPIHSPSWLLLWFIGCAQTAAYDYVCTCFICSDRNQRCPKGPCDRVSLYTLHWRTTRLTRLTQLTRLARLARITPVASPGPFCADLLDIQPERPAAAPLSGDFP